MNAMVKLQKLSQDIYTKVYDSKPINILFWFDNNLEIESKYHRKTVVLLLIAHILSLQEVVLRSMFFLIYFTNKAGVISLYG